MTKSAEPPFDRQRKLDRQPRDTAAGCRDHAAAELSRIGESTEAGLRRRLERNAAAWTARAEKLAIDEAA